MKRKYFVIGPVILILSILTFVILATKSHAGKYGTFESQTPTVIPSEVLTNISPTIELVTPKSPTRALTRPAIDLQQMYPVLPEVPLSNVILANKVEGILAGSGILKSVGPPVILHGDESGKYELSSLAWEEWTYDSFITVFTGRMKISPKQGIVWVQITPHYRLYQDRLVIPSPAQADTLSITGAVGERLVLKSREGQTFYFDVPSLRFVDSVEEKVPSATPVPKPTLTKTEDAPDIPLDVFTSQQISPKQVNIPIYSFINTPDDIDWFYFRVSISGTINVSLAPQSGNYGLRVVLVDKKQVATIMTEDTTSGTVKKQITIPKAPSGDYLVRVWSLDGSFSDSQPYTLRFEAPEPQRVIPILECVTENADGTYTAHFGYNNPNPFVVVLDAKNRQNRFEPPPIFRTGQPEAFAPGRVTNWFSVLFDSDLSWILDGNVVTANRNSPKCS